MPDTRPRPRQETDTARHQHKTLAWTTAARIERMAGQVQDDLKHGRPVSVTGLQLVTAAAVLMEELKAIATRDEIAARAKTAA